MPLPVLGYGYDEGSKHAFRWVPPGAGIGGRPLKPTETRIRPGRLPGMIGVCLRRAWLALAVCLLGVMPAAKAAPYWIAYEGDAWPEDEGWWHIWGPRPAYRWIEDGALVIDSLDDILIADFYEMHTDGQRIDHQAGRAVRPAMAPAGRAGGRLQRSRNRRRF